MPNVRFCCSVRCRSSFGRALRGGSSIGSLLLENSVPLRPHLIDCKVSEMLVKMSDVLKTNGVGVRIVACGKVADYFLGTTY